MRLVILVRGFIQLLLIDIDHGDDVVIERDVIGIGEAFATRADLCEAQSLASSVLAFQQEVRHGEGSAS